MRFQFPIIIALGSNLGSRHGSPRTTLEIAIRHLKRVGLDVYKVSPWFDSAPLPPSPQAMFVNGVVFARTLLSPERLIAVLQKVERDFGRVRRKRNEPRVLDLDLISYGRVVCGGPGAAGLVLPHARAHERAFVLQPLRLIAPAWRHPVLELTARELVLGKGGVRTQRTFISSRPLHRSRGQLKKTVRP